MNCSQCENLFAESIENLLDPELQHDFERHLAECVSCQKGLQETQALVARLQRTSGTAGADVLSAAVVDRVIRQDQQRVQRLTRLSHLFRLALAGCIVAGVAFAWSQFTSSPAIGQAVAADLAAVKRQASQAKTVKWKTTFYPRRNSQNGTGNLVLEAFGTRECYYQEPGRYREVHLDQQGAVRSIDLHDSVRLQRLLLDPVQKKATLYHLNEPMFDPHGPFAVPLETLTTASLKALGKKEIAGHEATGFRYAFRVPEENAKWSYDFWIDPQSKQLLTYQVPGVDVVDPDKVYPNPVQGMSAGGGFRMFDIQFGAELDDSLFRLDIPAGYKFESKRAPKIEEQEVTEFLKFVAEFLDGTFPEQMPHFGQGAIRDRLTVAESKSPDKRSVVETKLLEARQKYLRPDGPLEDFIDHEIVKGSWKYLGDGVKLGDASQIVCWFRVTNSKKYRVIYGDLSIKDVAPQDLPLPVAD